MGLRVIFPALHRCPFVFIGKYSPYPMRQGHRRVIRRLHWLASPVPHGNAARGLRRTTPPAESFGHAPGNCTLLGSDITTSGSVGVCWQAAHAGPRTQSVPGSSSDFQAAFSASICSGERLERRCIHMDLRAPCLGVERSSRKQQQVRVTMYRPDRCSHSSQITAKTATARARRGACRCDGSASG